MKTSHRAIPYDAVKRGLDLVAASVVFAVTLPVQAVVVILIAAKLGRPVLFRQQRPGLDGEVFTLVKFRTMKDPDLLGGLVTDAQRLTHFGQVLRSTSLDELPTLVNVIRGDMSMVGPRPLLVSYLERYDPEQARRHEVRPGITGLAQVNGRNALSWREKFALDIEYVDKRRFALDARILARTISSVFKREGISTKGHATMHEFTGTPEGGESA